MSYIVKIPMKPHLSQFLKFRLHFDQQGILHLSQKCAISSYLILLFTTKTKCTFDGVGLPVVSYSDQIKIKLTSKNLKYGEIFLDNDRIRRWNEFVHSKLHEYLETRISIYELHGKQIKDAIWDFIHESDMEDLISFDALKKANYRLRQSRTIH